MSACHGGKSSNSRLMANMIQTTQMAGKRVHVLSVLRYLKMLNATHNKFWVIPTTIFAIIL